MGTGSTYVAAPVTPTSAVVRQALPLKQKTWRSTCRRGRRCRRSACADRRGPARRHDDAADAVGEAVLGGLGACRAVGRAPRCPAGRWRPRALPASAARCMRCWLVHIQATSVTRAAAPRSTTDMIAKSGSTCPRCAIAEPPDDATARHGWVAWRRSSDRRVEGHDGRLGERHGGGLAAAEQRARPPRSGSPSDSGR